jgi:hypothetical protein
VIYAVHWLTCSDFIVSQWSSEYIKNRAKIGARFTFKSELATFIKESKNDTFIFILVKTQDQLEPWEKWLEDYGLEDLVVLRTKGITNPIHSQYKHNLVLAVLQSKEHFQRKETKENQQ